METPSISSLLHTARVAALLASHGNRALRAQLALIGRLADLSAEEESNDMGADDVKDAMDHVEEVFNNHLHALVVAVGFSEEVADMYVEAIGVHDFEDFVNTLVVFQ